MCNGKTTTFGPLPGLPDPNIFEPQPGIEIEPPPPFVPTTYFPPGFGTDMTTLTRVYNLEQDVIRLKMELDELRKSYTQMDAKLTAAPEVVANAVVLAFDKTRTPRAARKPVKSKKNKR